MKVIALMCEDPSAPLDWDALARTAGFSRFYFLRMFEEITGAAPHRFLMAIRLEKAKHLLLKTTLPVCRIASRTGYATSGGFINTFKTFVGVYPEQFRQLADYMSPSRLESLVAEYLEQPANACAEHDSFRFIVHGPPTFNGVTFVHLSDTASDSAPKRFAIGHNGCTRGRLPFPRRQASLLATAFPEKGDVTDYLLPDQNNLLIASSVISPRADSTPKRNAAVLQLRKSSFFDPPVVVCLPQLLLDHQGTSHTAPIQSFSLAH